jgi:hypothetical protein
MSQAEQMMLIRPTWHTVPIGARIWFYHSSLVKMPARVVYSTRSMLRVRPERGTLVRELALRWDEVYWRETDAKLPDRVPDPRSGKMVRPRLSPQDVVVHDDRYGAIDGKTAAFLRAARQDRPT